MWCWRLLRSSGWGGGRGGGKLHVPTVPTRVGSGRAWGPAERGYGGYVAWGMDKARSTFTHLCRECRSSNTMEDHHSGDIVCTDCGLVIGRVIDQGEEWRTFADDEGPDKSRVGTARNDLLSEGGAMSTSIVHQKKDGPSGGYATLRSVGAAQQTTADKHLLEAFKRLRFMAERIDIPHAIRGRAEEIYKQLYETKQLNGRKQEVPHHRSPFLKRFLPALFLCQHFACATPGALVAH